MNEIYLPALRANIGDWIYYATTMSFGELANRVTLASKLQPSQALKDLLQRELNTSDRTRSISNYLINQEQRFISSLVVAVYGGDPSWSSIDIKGIDSSGENISEKIDHRLLGVLRLDGSEELFALDGQHRLFGIKDALEKDPTLASERISVLFVSHDESSSEGVIRSRRLFTTLNKHAKKVSRYDRIAIDEDDVVSISIREIMTISPLLINRVSMRKTKPIPPTDYVSFTSLVTLYDAINYYVKPHNSRGWNNFLNYRPPDSEVDEYIYRTSNLISEIYGGNKDLVEYANIPTDKFPASEYRSPDGGNVLFRPIGFESYVIALKHLAENDSDLGRHISNLSSISLDLTQKPWSGILYNNRTGRMISTMKAKKLAACIFMYHSEGSLSRAPLPENKALEAASELLDADITDIAQLF